MAVDRNAPAILIIENDEDTRRLYADALASVEATLIESANPYDAFDQLGTHPVSLILTDLHMPGGGLEFLANLRAVNACPIIVVTGLGGDAVRRNAMIAGASEFLEKPVRTKQLRAVVDRFLHSTSTAT
jgi:CheY-like chemotaxis protein